MNLQQKTFTTPLATTMRQIFQEAIQMGLMLHAEYIKEVNSRQAEALNRLELAGYYQKIIKYLTTALLQLGLTLHEDMIATQKKCKERNILLSNAGRCSNRHRRTSCCLVEQGNTYQPTTNINEHNYSETSHSKQLYISGDSNRLAESMVKSTNAKHGIGLDYSRQFQTNIQTSPLNEAQENKITSRKGNKIRDQNWRGDIIFNQLSIAKAQEIEEQESQIKEMGTNLWRTRRAALSYLTVYFKSTNKNASSLHKRNVVQDARRVLDGMQKMGKSNQQMSVIKGRECSFFVLLIKCKDFIKSPLISSFMKPIVSGIINKPRYSKAWNINKLFDFESLKSNEKTQ
ncbi:MAG: hypothetical protein EZS28_011327 [Streblomastix strix]|uniref:Uncharacterized protein n=1 Tax=Streblomastix strix TaxID=222440 RepID=A0A5J4WDS6_9EUKA|nr:MAG: hypothetical protein EZS28_011327 [Streblomastix strix]